MSEYFKVKTDLEKIFEDLNFPRPDYQLLMFAATVNHPIPEKTLREKMMEIIVEGTSESRSLAIEGAKARLLKSKLINKIKCSN